jgi:Domain of unknown function (DUF4129)
MRGRLFGAAAALAALAAVTTTAAVRAAGCPALDYQAGLVSATAALRQTPANVPAALGEVTALVGADRGSEVALGPVLDDLTASPPLVNDARVRLSSMSAALAYPAGSVCNENAGAARDALHNVYASPDFRHLDDSNQPGFLAGVLRFLAGLFGAAAGALGTVGGSILAIVVAGLALLFAWRRWHGSAALPGATSAEPQGDGDDPDAEWAAAQRAATAAEYREAVRRAFRSALLEVAVRGRLHIDPAWTTRELLQRCNAQGDVLAALAAAAALFEHAWYGRVAVTVDDWTRAEERSAAVRRLARQAGAMAR